MTDALRDLLRRVSAHAGLHPPAWVLAARVRDRLAALALADARAYLRVLDGDGGAGELDKLTEALRVGETRFFRHRAHVDALRRAVLPELVGARAGRRRLRAWSAGCATGEEAWTLAMLLAEAAGDAPWEVLATDLSAEALAVAKAGRYPAAALAGVPEALRNQAFARAGGAGEAWQVTPPLAARVRFERHNLRGEDWPRGEFDLILCRNVLIYFEPEARRAVVERLVERLAPGGYLFLGYAESLRGFAGLEAVAGEDGVIYRRKAPAARVTPVAGVPVPRVTPVAGVPVRRVTPVAGVPVTAAAAMSAPAAVAAPAPRVLAPSISRGPGVLVLSGQLDDPAALASALGQALEAAGARLVVDLDGASFLAEALAPVLRRAAAAAAAAGVVVELRAARPGPRRWLARHGLAAAAAPRGPA